MVLNHTLEVVGGGRRVIPQFRTDFAEFKKGPGEDLRACTEGGGNASQGELGFPQSAVRRGMAGETRPSGGFGISAGCGGV